ncbi:MAG: hypothetical protein ABIQ18_29260 [Umezawaea sp.]
MSAAIAVAALVALVSGSSTAFAADSGSGALPVGFVQFTNAQGKTAGWASLEYLKANPTAIPRVRVDAARTDRAAAAMSASGCNHDVCIAIVGSSLTVNQWSTQAFGNVGCSHAYFVSATFTVQGREICPSGTGSGVCYDNTGPTGVYSNDEQLCDDWQNVWGFPPSSRTTHRMSRVPTVGLTSAARLISMAMNTVSTMVDAGLGQRGPDPWLGRVGRPGRTR